MRLSITNHLLSIIIIFHFLLFSYLNNFVLCEIEKLDPPGAGSCPAALLSSLPSAGPSLLPSAVSSVVHSSIRSLRPSLSPSTAPRSAPSVNPSGAPSSVPSSVTEFVGKCCTQYRPQFHSNSQPKSFTECRTLVMFKVRYQV
jgi:hypothetical protein